MSEPSLKKRIWGWFFFDWASQPYHTLIITFVFGPYFVGVAADTYMAGGIGEEPAKAQAQSFWSLGLMISGLIIGFGGPVIGALADAAGRRMPWIAVFSVLFVLGASALWWVTPDGSNLTIGLIAFGIGFIGAEYALIFTNAQLPTLGDEKEVGKLSGTGFAFGYVGGLVSLLIMLLLFVEQANGKTLIGLAPAFGLDPELREGTRFVGPFVAIWFAIFMIPYFLWVRETHVPEARRPAKMALAQLWGTIRALPRRPSLLSFLGSSMLYRDGLNGLYAFGGTYAALVLDWDITRIGIFGIVSVISAAGMTWVGGRLDARFGPRPVIFVSIIALGIVCVGLINMSRDAIFGVTLVDGSNLPDNMFMVAGVLIGGLGGIVQAASRSMMTRHTTPENATETFGLFGFAGRATSFLAPGLIGLVTLLTENARLGFLPVIGLFILGLILLRWTNPDGEQHAS
ncbi:MFS transporter [Rhodobacteraceae bacterium]|nr:MFS transporter [Paracoccaceae bacterium]